MSVIRRDRFGLLMSSLAAMLILLPLAALVMNLLQTGLPGLTPDFLFTAPSAGGRQGGIGPLLVSTALILAVCLAAVVPFGLGSALFLSECIDAGSPTARRLGYSLDILAGIPSIVRVILPAAGPGIAAGMILSIGRALAETAVLLFTAGYVLRMPGSLLDSGRALSVHIYDMSMNVPGGMPVAARTALVLLIFMVLTNLAVRRLLMR